MPPPSSSSRTKSHPEPNAAAIVSIPESFTIDTGARACPASNRSVLSNGGAPALSTHATRPRRTNLSARPAVPTARASNSRAASVISSVWAPGFKPPTRKPTTARFS